LNFAVHNNFGNNILDSPRVKEYNINDYDLTTPFGVYLNREACFISPNHLIGMTKLELLDGYLDTSGKESNIKDIAIAATICLATPSQWLKFRDEWNKVLENTPLERDEKTGNYAFHTTEFWAKKSKPYKDDDGWTDSNPPESGKVNRNTVYRSLIEVITRNTAYSTGFSVLLEDYRKLKNDYSLAKYVVPQAGALATIECVIQCARWAKQNDFKPRFSLVTDWNDEFWKQTKPAFDEMIKGGHFIKGWGIDIASYTEGNKSEFVGIQAADLAAWEFTKFIKQQVGRDIEHGLKIKPSFNALGANDATFNIYSFEELRNDFLEHVRETFRDAIRNSENTEIRHIADDEKYLRDLDYMVFQEMRDFKDNDDEQ
jgi:hypothetical protein